jgi:hypothetical protein
MYRPLNIYAIFIRTVRHIIHIVCCFIRIVHSIVLIYTCIFGHILYVLAQPYLYSIWLRNQCNSSCDDLLGKRSRFLEHLSFTLPQTHPHFVISRFNFDFFISCHSNNRDNYSIGALLLLSQPKLINFVADSGYHEQRNKRALTECSCIRSIAVNSTLMPSSNLL